jgi:hypothetical protein
VLSLAFTLAVVAAITFLIVVSTTGYNASVKMNPVRVRGFKKDELTAASVSTFKRGKWIIVSLASVKAQPGVETKFELSGDVARIFMSSKYAGRFTGLTLQFEVKDVLNLFSKQVQTLYTDFILDSLPLSILIPIPHSKPMPLALGEKSGKSPGSSLELYALDDYRPFTETKNLMWKKIARMPDERLIVRVRDSSIPRIVRIGFVQSKMRYGAAKLVWMDLACEAVGMIGNSLLAAGCSIEIIHTSQGANDPISVHEVSSLDELPDAVMRIPDPPRLDGNLQYQFEILSRSDLVVCGMSELEQEGLSLAISKKPTLAIAEEGASPIIVGQHTMIYTGVEDVRKLISKILEV